jgi:DNA-binding NarL/FixJ family response regulator
LGSDDPGDGHAPTRVLIADDHPVFRRGLREHLEASGLNVVAEAEDVGGAVALSVESEPEVILMDIRMPGGSSIDAIRRLRMTAPRTQVLLMTGDVEDGEAVEAILAGASGCLLKGSDGDQVLAAISTVAAGESALSPRIASALIERARKHEPPPAPTHVERTSLTGRERQVLSLIVEGKDNNEIAAALVISPETVKTHVSTVLEKLGAGNRVAAAVKAVRAELV